MHDGDKTSDAGDKVSIYYSPFAAGKDIHCLWDWDLDRTNLTFLEGVDHDYFRYVADIHGEALKGPDRHRAGIALRIAYHQGLEALFSFIFAALQAPDCIPAWIIKCSNTSDLRHLVVALNNPCRN